MKVILMLLLNQGIRLWRNQ